VPAPGALNLVILCPAGTCASEKEEAAITNERVANTESAKKRERVMGKFLLRQGLDAFGILKTRAGVYLLSAVRTKKMCCPEPSYSGKTTPSPHLAGSQSGVREAAIAGEILPHRFAGYRQLL
jgi:hypothetical protein